MVNELMNIQSVADATYIAGIQKKAISHEYRLNIANIENSLNQLKQDVEYYRSNISNVWENQVASTHAFYENEDAKPAKSKIKSLKRKSHDVPPDSVPDPKRYNNIKVMSDSAAGHEDEMNMEYCSVPSNLIVVQSRNSALTLRPINLSLQPRNAMNTGNAKTSDVPQTSEERVNSTANYPSIKKRSLNRNGILKNGDNNDSDSDDEKSHKELKPNSAQLLSPPPQQEEVQKKYDDYRAMFQADWRNSQGKNVAQHFEHAYNDCKEVKGFGKCGRICRRLETIEFCNKVVQEVVAGRDLESQMITMQTLAYHALFCGRDEECEMPLCTDFKPALQALFENPGDGFYNEPAEVLYSNTSAFEEGEKLVEGSDFFFNYQAYIAKGTFGSVRDTWTVTRDMQEARLAVKQITRTAGQKNTVNIDEMAKSLKTLGKVLDLPNLLMPDLVISSKSRMSTYLFMEKGEISLACYLEKVYEVHTKSCSKKDHFGPCNSGLPVETCSLYFAQIAQGLQQLHELGFTHGDLKPDNVMIMTGYQTVKLIDLDFLKKEEKPQSSGTPGYLAPEVFPNGNVIKASDVFSLCCCLAQLYYALNMTYNKEPAGLLKFTKERNEYVVKWLKQKDKRFAMIFERGTEWDPDKRITVSEIVKCFHINEVMRDRKLTNLKIPDHKNVYPNRGKAAQATEETICKKVLRKWLDDITDRVPRHLYKLPVPVKVEVEDVESAGIGVQELSLEDILAVDKEIVDEDI